MKWLRSWGKRSYRFFPLLAANLRQGWLRRGGAKIGVPAFISPCILNGPACNLSVGRGSFVGRVELHLHEAISIGENVVLNDGAIIFTASHDVNSPEFATTKRLVCISDYAWVASGAMILPGVHIGRGAVVGAGAVVTHDVPDYGIVVGNAARLLEKQRNRDLSYVPAFLAGPLQAWVGKRITL